MTYPRVTEVVELLEHRKLEITTARRADGAPVWRGTVRSVRRVVWCVEDVDLGVVFTSLDAWLDTDTHKGDCCCRICLAKREALVEGAEEK